MILIIIGCLMIGAAIGFITAVERSIAAKQAGLYGDFFKSCT